MNSGLTMWLILLIGVGSLVFEYMTYKKNKRNGYGTNLRPLSILATVIVIIYAVYSLLIS